MSLFGVGPSPEQCIIGKWGRTAKYTTAMAQGALDLQFRTLKTRFCPQKWPLTKRDARRDIKLANMKTLESDFSAQNGI